MPQVNDIHTHDTDVAAAGVIGRLRDLRHARRPPRILAARAHPATIAPGGLVPVYVLVRGLGRLQLGSLRRVVIGTLEDVFFVRGGTKLTVTFIGPLGRDDRQLSVPSVAHVAIPPRRAFRLRPTRDVALPASASSAIPMMRVAITSFGWMRPEPERSAAFARAFRPRFHIDGRADPAQHPPTASFELSGAVTDGLRAEDLDEQADQS